MPPATPWSKNNNQRPATPVQAGNNFNSRKSVTTWPVYHATTERALLQQQNGIFLPAVLPVGKRVGFLLTEAGGRILLEDPDISKPQPSSNKQSNRWTE